jgi:putative endopeptidase
MKRSKNVFLALMVTSFLLSISLVLPLSSALAEVKAAKPELGTWGFDTTALDPSIKPGDDFFLYANGSWVKRTEIPATASRIGNFSILNDKVDANVRSILEEAATNSQAPRGGNSQKIGDWYASFMDEPRIDQLGLSVLKADLDRIAAITTRSDLARVLGENNGRLSKPPISAYVKQDDTDPTKRVLALSVGGFSMDRQDAYLDPQQEPLRRQHRVHLARMLALAGVSDPDARASRIQSFETQLARSTEQPNADRKIEAAPVVPSKDLPTRFPGIDWTVFLAAAGVAKESSVVVESPAALASAAKLVAQEPFAVWKDYLIYQLLKSSAVYLPRAFGEEKFAFYQKTLEAQPAMESRSKLAIEDTQVALPLALGEVYIRRYVDPKAKATAEVMVKELVAAFDARLVKLTWMTPATRKAARDKLAKMTMMIAYPDRWPSYAGLEVIRGDAYGNAQRAAEFRRANELSGLGKPIDRSEWEPTFYPYSPMATPNPMQNTFYLFAGMLQPPFFDQNADPAANYGGVGAVIAHEITHLFDNMGRHFDSEGRLWNWWAPEDEAQFNARTKALAEQVSRYEVLPGQYVNGQYTLHENIADLGGISIAYDAYQQSLGGKPSPIIEGLTGDQRFFLAWSQNWRSKYRDDRMAILLKTSTWPPDRVRPFFARNLDAWYKAFDVKPGDKLYLSPEQRVQIW